MRWRRVWGTIAVAGLLMATGGWTQSPKVGGSRLKVYFVDVEGGQATLFVTPAGQALLIDTGWAGNEARDADRIAAAAKDAGLKKIDYVLITHYHDDHVGGVPQLLEKVPVGAFIDHGPNREEATVAEKNYAAYEKALTAAKVKRILAKPGDVLPIVGMKATVISSDGKVIESALEGGGEANAFCKGAETKAPDSTENARSVGVEITFGKLKLLDLGDLTWAKETELMCPMNRLGRVDIYIVSHHGSELSSNPALVHAIGARVAVMDNGTKKGGSPSVLDTVQSAPGLEALWQLHFSEEAGEDSNTADDFIANLDGPDNGHFIELLGSGDGSFDMVNSRTGGQRHYGPATQPPAH